MKAPVYTSLLMAVLAAYLLSASALAQGQALAISPATIEYDVSVGENDYLFGHRDSGSGRAGGSLSSFSFSDQNRDRRQAGVMIPRMMPESGISEGRSDVFADRCHAPVSGARISPVRGLDDLFHRTVSAPAVGPKNIVAIRCPVALDECDRVPAIAVLAAYPEGQQPGQQSAAFRLVQ